MRQDFERKEEPAEIVAPAATSALNSSTSPNWSGLPCFTTRAPSARRSLGTKKKQILGI